MDLADLEIFVAVVRRGNFAAVAKERDLDPSSVSRSIAKLEGVLGLRLLQRTTRRVTLTEAGEIYLARIEPLVEELVGAQEAAAGTSEAPRGTLRLTASVTFGQVRIVPLLAELRALYPDLKVVGLFTDAIVDLVAERVDLAIRLAPTIEGDLIAAKLMDTHWRVVASPGYVAAHPRLAQPSDLGRHRCVLFNLRPYRTRWTFRNRAGRLEDVPIEGDIVLAPAGAIRDAALAGLGPALLPDWLIDEDIAAGRLVDAFPNHAVTATAFDTAAWLVYPSRAFLPNKVRVVIDFLRERIDRPQSQLKTSRKSLRQSP
jgi:DNA-binding transcriptional LysR family regulator